MEDIPERRVNRRRAEDLDSVTHVELETILMVHAQRERQVIAEEMRKLLEPVFNAFPDGTESHRASHERMMKAAEAEENFWKDLKAEMAKKSIWGILQILIFLSVAGLAAKFGINLFPMIEGAK